MDGLNTGANTLDETLVESGAVLITPMAANQKLYVNDAFGVDLRIEGKLLHQNGMSLGGIKIIGNAHVEVATNAEIELAAFGNAMRWAGNPKINFEDGAYFIHHTSLPGTLGSGVIFPNAGTQVAPVFVVADSITFPGRLVNPNSTLRFNGVVHIQPDAALRLGGSGKVEVREDLIGDGDLITGEEVSVEM